MGRIQQINPLQVIQGGKGSDQRPVPDRRAMEKALRFYGDDDLEKKPAKKAALEAAQELIWDAWEESSIKKRIAMARKALELSPDCADAYVVLAEDAAYTLEEIRDLYQQGVEAGERALGRKIFHAEVGYFWGILETRPYMRARAGLAACLEEMVQYDEAIAHYHDMLRLNTNDNQGIRYCLMAALLDQGAIDDLDKFINKGPYRNDVSCEWLYTKALVSFLKRGRWTADLELSMAFSANPHVPSYLLGRKQIPKYRSDYITMGGEDEAMAYASRCQEAWQRYPEARQWLALRADTTPLVGRKVGRNDHCPCGSGKKSKRCCFA